MGSKASGGARGPDELDLGATEGRSAGAEHFAKKQEVNPSFQTKTPSQ